MTVKDFSLVAGGPMFRLPDHTSVCVAA